MFVMHYRTEDGLADYGFSIGFWPGTGWRVYIAFRPLNQNHDDGLDSAYKSVDDHGRHYVDWPAKIDSLGDAKTVAALWAELIQLRQRAPKASRGNDEASLDLNAMKETKLDAARSHAVPAEFTAAVERRTVLVSTACNVGRARGRALSRGASAVYTNALMPMRRSMAPGREGRTTQDRLLT
jgi:hypothetical protein